MSKKEEKQFKNPAEYGYKGDEKVTITGFQFRESLKNTQECLADEIMEYYPEQTKMINREYQEATEEEIAKGEAFEVLDLEAMLQNPRPMVFYTKKGLNLLRQNFMLEGVHNENIENGTATSIAELRKQAADSQKPKMSKVE